MERGEAVAVLERDFEGKARELASIMFTICEQQRSDNVPTQIDKALMATALTLQESLRAFIEVSRIKRENPNNISRLPRIFIIYVTLFNSGMGNRTGVLNASKVIASKDSSKQI